MINCIFNHFGFARILFMGILVPVRHSHVGPKKVYHSLVGETNGRTDTVFGSWVE